jgi:hypothetical protein
MDSYGSSPLRAVGRPSRRCVQEFSEPCLVSIAHGRFAIWLDPFGMLDPQLVVNLLQELSERADLMRQRRRLGERFNSGAARFL